MKYACLYVIIFWIIKIHNFKNYLRKEEHRTRMHYSLLCMILNDLDTNIVAMRAGNTYAITYSLLASVSTPLKLHVTSQKVNGTISVSTVLNR